MYEIYEYHKRADSAPVLSAGFNRIVRKALVTVGLASALTAGSVAFVGTALAQELPNHASFVASASQPLPTWCPFGTHGGDDGGCRGGSIVNDIRKHGYQYTTTGVCTAAGMATKNPEVGVGCGILLMPDPAY
jgi:hypothetical protein